MFTALLSTNSLSIFFRYPPGVLCVVPGEVWGGAVLRYFLALEEGVNMLPGFSPELQGVYSETDPDGIKRLYGYVLKG